MAEVWKRDSLHGSWLVSANWAGDVGVVFWVQAPCRVDLKYYSIQRLQLRVSAASGMHCALDVLEARGATNTLQDYARMSS